MNIFQSEMTKNLKQYIKIQGRIDVKLAKLVEICLKKPKSQSILTIIKSQTKVSPIFKMLILVNQLIMANAINIDSCREILNNIRFSCETQLQHIIVDKGLKPYLKYLQRRNEQRQFLLLKSQEQQQQITQIYKLINLINLASNFIQFIFTIGRYCHSNLQFTADFNITLAKDIKIMYDNLKMLVRDIDNEELMKEIEIMHEKMYLVFFNCYYGYNTICVEIQWIKTFQRWEDCESLEEEKKYMLTEVSFQPLVEQLYSVIESCADRFQYQHQGIPINELDKKTPNRYENCIKNLQYIQKDQNNPPTAATLKALDLQGFSSAHLQLSHQRNIQSQLQSIKITQFKRQQ